MGLRPELVSGECRTAAEYCTALVPAPAQPHLARLQAAKSPAQLPGPDPASLLARIMVAIIRLAGPCHGGRRLGAIIWNNPLHRDVIMLITRPGVCCCAAVWGRMGGQGCRPPPRTRIFCTNMKPTDNLINYYNWMKMFSGFMVQFNFMDFWGKTSYKIQFSMNLKAILTI